MTIVDVDLEMEKGVTEPPKMEPVASIDPLSLPSKHTDPFTKREGKTLTWKNINMTLVRPDCSNGKGL